MLNGRPADGGAVTERPVHGRRTANGCVRALRERKGIRPRGTYRRSGRHARPQRPVGRCEARGDVAHSLKREADTTARAKAGAASEESDLTGTGEDVPRPTQNRLASVVEDDARTDDRRTDVDDSRFPGIDRNDDEARLRVRSRRRCVASPEAHEGVDFRCELSAGRRVAEDEAPYDLELELLQQGLHTRQSSHANHVTHDVALRVHQLLLRASSVEPLVEPVRVVQREELAVVRRGEGSTARCHQTVDSVLRAVDLVRDAQHGDKVHSSSGVLRDPCHDIDQLAQTQCHAVERRVRQLFRQSLLRCLEVSVIGAVDRQFHSGRVDGLHDLVTVGLTGHDGLELCIRVRVRERQDLAQNSHLVRRRELRRGGHCRWRRRDEHDSAEDEACQRPQSTNNAGASNGRPLCSDCVTRIHG